MPKIDINSTGYDEEEKTQESKLTAYCYGFWNLRAGRYKTEMIRLLPHKRANKKPEFLDPAKPGLYNEDWKFYNPRGKLYRNWVTYFWYLLTKYGWSVSLFILLCADGIIFGSFIDIKAELGFSGDLCVHDTDKVAYYAEYFRNQTGYYDALEMANRTTNYSNWVWNRSYDRYEYSAASNTSWPKPYMPDGTNSTTVVTVEEKDCGYKKKYCYDAITKYFGWFCAKVDVPCTWIYTTIDSYYYWTEAEDFDYLGSAVYNKTAEVDSLAASVLDAIYARLVCCFDCYLQQHNFGFLAIFFVAFFGFGVWFESMWFGLVVPFVCMCDSVQYS